MVAEVNNIVSRLKWPSQALISKKCLHLGQSFEEDSNIKKMLKMIAGYNYTRLPKRLKEERIGWDSISLNRESEFYLFLLILNNYYDSVNNTIFEGFEDTVKNLAIDLNIDSTDYMNLMSFYFCNLPFCDKVDSIYITHENTPQIKKASGYNIVYEGKNPGEVIYLKYFKRHDLFLSKTYNCYRPYNEILEDVSTKEINVICSTSYKSAKHLLNYNNLKRRLETFMPLQYVSVSETENTPRIILDPEKNLLSVVGTSIPLSPTTYFEPILDWVDLYSRLGANKLVVVLSLNYFNTYTAKFIVRLVKSCNALAESGKSISFQWHYDNEDEEMKDFGDYLETLLSEKVAFENYQYLTTNS